MASPGQQNVQHAAGSAKKMFGIDLAGRFLANLQDEQLREEFTVFCYERVIGIVRYLVVGCALSPPARDKYAFCEDTCQDVVVKVIESINSLESPEDLAPWLHRISIRVIVDEYRRVVGRGKIKRTEVGSETEEDEGEIVDTFETEEVVRAAADRNGRSYGSPEAWAEKIKNRDLLDNALLIHGMSGSKRDFESSLWVKETWDYPDVTPTEIAKQRKRSVGDTQHILHDDNNALIPIAKYLVDPDAAEKKWAVLLENIEAASRGNLDPGSPEAEVLAERWQEIGGHLDVMEKLRKQHAEEANGPTPLSLSEEMRAFITSAVEARKKKKPKKCSEEKVGP